MSTAGRLGSAGTTPPHRYYTPLRHPLIFRRLPGVPGYTTYLVPSISRWDEEGFSSCLTSPCHRAVALTPLECPIVSASLRLAMLSSPSGSGLDLQTCHLTRPPWRSYALRPDDSRTILQMVVPMGFRPLVSRWPAIHATGRLAFAQVGLTPTDDVSLFWTHFRTVGFPQSGSDLGLPTVACPERAQLKC